MSDISGLQIDPRCIRCGRPPTAHVPLLEMRNHLYICEQCRQDEEHKGKQIAWAEGTTPMEQAGMLGGKAFMTRPLTSHAPTIQWSANDTVIPKNSLFGMLGVPLTASQSDVEHAIDEKMLFWMREGSSDERQRMIDQLREWQEALISDPGFLQKQAGKLQPRRPRGSALMIDGKPVYSAKELLSQCEGSERGWNDAKALLEKGELHPWILYHIGDRVAANDMDRLARTNVPTHRVLNYVLYRLVPERPFRLYSREIWQPIASVPEAQTPEELAHLCDQYWTSAEWHLYKGAMIAWLEFSQGCKGLGQYYDMCIKPYAEDYMSRGLGLELVLERIAPKLPRPKLITTFNGIRSDSYVQETWDREVPHPPVTVQVDNTTRGFSKLTLEIVDKKTDARATEPDWLHLVSAQATHSSGSDAPIRIFGKKEAVMPASARILFTDLEQLQRGRRYERTLRLTEQREYGREPVIHEYPIVLQTMSYFQGFRGLLWRYGLRGDIPGLLWNAIIGMILAALASQYLLTNTLLLSNSRVPSSIKSISFISMLQPALAGLVHDLYALPLLNFVLITGIITGLIGLRVGFKQGYVRYTQKESAAGFFRGTFFLLLMLFLLLLTLHARSFGSLNYLFYTEGGTLFYAGGSLLTCFLIFIIVCILIAIRSILEQLLRARFAPPMNIEEKEV